MTAAPDPTTTEAEARAAFTAGLRALADALDASPDLPLPYPRVTAHIGIYQVGGGVEMAGAIVRQPGRWETDDDDMYFILRQNFGPIDYRVNFSRAAVCEQREVTKTVTEWVCPSSLLAEAERRDEVVA